MNLVLPLLASFACVFSLGAGDAVPDVVSKAVSTSPRPHPRLLWPSEQMESAKARIQQDQKFKNACEAAILRADHALSEPPVIYRKEGRRLLQRSREALDRMTHLSFAARMTGDAKYVQRAEAEMRAMGGMQDWNPSH